MNSHNGLFKTEADMRWFVSGNVDDVSGWLGGKVSNRSLLEAIGTPVSMGGLEVYEFADVNTNGGDREHLTKNTLRNHGSFR